MAAERHIGILAGGGEFPREIAESAAARGCPVHIVAIDGEADGDFSSFPVTRVNWGQLGGMLRAFKDAGTQDLVIVGHVRRPDLMRLKMDMGFFMNLPAIAKIIAAGGDDGVLRRVVRFFEGHGLTVIGPAMAAPELVIGKGLLGSSTPSERDDRDIELGFSLVRALGPYDIGQSVIVRDGVVEAIEGAEGTDRMLERTAAERRSREIRSGGVLVKRTKPGQDLRVDMPAIGPETVARVVEAGLNGIAVEADGVLVTGRFETIHRADEADVFVVGSTDKGSSPDEHQETRDEQCLPVSRLGWIGIRGRHRQDIARGAAVVGTLAPFHAGQAAVVVRRHVLAVEAGEGVAEMLERASRLRQWGRATARRRSGVVVLADARDVSRELVSRVATAGFDGVLLLGGVYTQARVRDAVEYADHAGLFVVAAKGGYEE
jgi:UDP-2,3-diacylglucosamine hydrolase